MAQSTQTLIVKLHLGTEIRRFTVGELNWDDLNKRIKASFDLRDDVQKSHKVTYVDDEQDVITISSNEELQEALGLAKASSPSVLRLTVVLAKGTTDEAVSQTNKLNPALPTEAPPLTTEATQKKNTTNYEPTAAPAPPNAPGGQPQLPPCFPPELAPFVEGLIKTLPQAMAMMPPEMKAFLPHAELDLAATIAAAQAASKDRACNTTEPAATDRFCPDKPHAPNVTVGVHDGVTCDKSGVTPIVGNRYHLVGHNYDLCEAEYLKLTEKERALFHMVPPPSKPTHIFTSGIPATPVPTNGKPPPAQAESAPLGVHPGVVCDKSGMSPIVGNRYHLKGHDYDLCQAEFDKLPATEQSLYELIAPPWRGGAWGCRGGHGHGMGGHPMMGGHCGRGMAPWASRRPEEPKLAARFVRDVSIFDGTQMAPGTTFTKIWRIKNVGEMAWPAGTRILYVGGDQMSADMSVPISRNTPVLPGEEVDVAVEMVAPHEHGRYLGYWRLTGPHMRRKFGQRVWCHVQVVDPSQSAADGFNADELPSVLAEIEQKKSQLAPDADEAPDVSDQPTTEPSTTDTEAKLQQAAEEAKAAEATKAEEEAKEAKAKAAAKAIADIADAIAEAEAVKATDTTPAAADGHMSDDGVLITDTDVAEATTTAPATTNGKGKARLTSGSAAGPSTVSVVEALGAMGFLDTTMVEAVIAKHGDDIEACARDLATASEWEGLLDDLEEMGFANRELNKGLMLKNDGNVKRTVRDLVEA